MAGSSAPEFCGRRSVFLPRLDLANLRAYNAAERRVIALLSLAPVGRTNILRHVAQYAGESGDEVRKLSD